MKITELDINILAVPQGYYLAHGISRDMNFKVGLPAQFDRQYNLKEKLQRFEDEIELGVSYLTDNVFSLVVKDSSYDFPDRDMLLEAIIDMRDSMEQLMATKLAIPKICCGRNGLDWEEVKAMFELVFADFEGQILVCVQ